MRQYIVLLLVISCVLAQQYSIHERFKDVFPSCSMNNTGACTDTALDCFSINDQDKTIIAVSQERGLKFYDWADGSGPRSLGSYNSGCDDLRVAGLLGGNIIVTHDQSVKCNCENPTTQPCPLQLEILSPLTIAGYIPFVEAKYSYPLALIQNDITAEIVLGLTNQTGQEKQGCEPLINEAEVTGKFVLLYRGACAFTIKFNHAVAAGAIGVIVANTQTAGLSTMNLGANFQVPGVMISYQNGEIIRAQLDAGQTVSGKLGANTGEINPNNGFAAGVGILSIPVSQFANTNQQVTGTAHTSLFKFAQGTSLEPSRPYLWVNSPGFDYERLLVVDLSDLSNPVVLLNTTSLPEILVFDYVRFFTRTNRWYLVGTNFATESLEVFDITDLSNVVLVKSLGGLIYIDKVIISDDTNTFYATTGGTDVTPYCVVIDATDLNNLKISRNITESQVPDDSKLSGIVASDSRLWLAWATDGLSAYDISENSHQILATMATKEANETSSYTSGVTNICKDHKSPNRIWGIKSDTIDGHTVHSYELVNTADTTGTTGASTTNASHKTLANNWVYFGLVTCMYFVLHLF